MKEERRKINVLSLSRTTGHAPLPSVGTGVAALQLTAPMGTQALAATWPTGHGVSHFCHLNKGRTVGVRAAILALLAALNQSDLG